MKLNLYALGMQKTFKSIRIICLLLLALCVSCSNEKARQVILECDLKDDSGFLFLKDFKYKSIYLLSTKKSIGYHITGNENRIGKLTVNDNFYYLVFPGNEKYWEVRVTINRHTGFIKIESGPSKMIDKPPFPYEDIGVCKPKKDQKL